MFHQCDSHSYSFRYFLEWQSTISEHRWIISNLLNARFSWNFLVHRKHILLSDLINSSFLRDGHNIPQRHQRFELLGRVLSIYTISISRVRLHGAIRRCNLRSPRAHIRVSRGLFHPLGPRRYLRDIRLLRPSLVSSVPNRDKALGSAGNAHPHRTTTNISHGVHGARPDNSLPRRRTPVQHADQVSHLYLRPQRHNLHLHTARRRRRPSHR